MEDAEEFCIEEDNNAEEEKKTRPIIKNAVDLQRLKLEKLMKNPDKPIIIPEQPREKDFMQSVPTFVRNVMGSSAGAGSGEFHVYRHLRRKEYARQKYIHAKSIREQLDDDYRNKLEQNKINAEAKTAKKRAKRLKKKQKLKERSKRQKVEGNESDTKEKSSDSSDSESNAKIDEKEFSADAHKEPLDNKTTSDSKCEDDASNNSPDKEEAISGAANDDETVQPDISVESQA